MPLQARFTDPPPGTVHTTLTGRVGEWAPIPLKVGFPSPLLEPDVPLSKYPAPHEYLTYLLEFNRE